jgi:hypothetical protein
VIEYLVAKRPYLRRVPGEAYFFTAIRHCAYRLLRSGWHRTVVAMDPGDVVLAEQAMQSQRRGVVIQPGQVTRSKPAKWGGHPEPK